MLIKRVFFLLVLGGVSNPLMSHEVSNLSSYPIR